MVFKKSKEAEMKECPNPNCSASAVAETDNFCYKCGAELKECMFCECSYQFCKADKFCPKCGKEKRIIVLMKIAETLGGAK